MHFIKTKLMTKLLILLWFGMLSQTTHLLSKDLTAADSDSPYRKARLIIDDFASSGFKPMMMRPFIALMTELNKEEKTKLLKRLDDYVEILTKSKSRYTTDLSNFRDYLSHREQLAKLEEEEGHEDSTLEYPTVADDDIDKTASTPLDNQAENSTQNNIAPTKELTNVEQIQQLTTSTVEGPALKLRSRVPSVASRNIVDYFENDHINKVNIEQLIRYHARLNEKQRQHVRNRLFHLYYRLIRTQPERAKKVKEIHKQLVEKHPRSSPLFSYAIAPQQPHADASDTSFFGKEPSQLKSNQMILELGSDILKLAPNLKHLRRQGLDVTGYEDRLDSIIQHPLYQDIFALDYRVMMLWAHGSHKNKNFNDGLGQEAKENLYDEFYQFTSLLLKRYSGSGKTFMIGNWEGDWMLMGGTPDGSRKASDEVPQYRIDNMIEWMNIRSKAISDAKTKVKHSDVDVVFYCEINHVNIQREKGVKRMVNAVLPHLKVDYVSISSYDMQGLRRFGSLTDTQARKEDIFAALDHVESFLPPSEIPGKRVFIGEIGYTVYNVKQFFRIDEGEAKQALMALENAVINLEWGMPFWVWWAFHDNEEISEENHNYRGFGLFDQINERQRMIYSEFESFYSWAKKWERRHSRLKTSKAEKFRKDAIKRLNLQIERLLPKVPTSGRRLTRR
jgi:hypothetical protein